MIRNRDKELFKVMEDSLKRYLKAAGLISQEGFDMLSEHNGLLWSEISNQTKILEELSKMATIEEHVPENKEPAIEETGFTTSLKKDGPVNLFNKVVEFMKTQPCDELQWVRTYSMKYTYEDFEDFQIKYFEHKDPVQEAKNYIMFGNTKKNYSIRKSGDDVVGDTSECFDIILNLTELGYFEK